MQHA
jgi:sedoheptulose-bisphosphatase